MVFYLWVYEYYRNGLEKLLKGKKDIKLGYGKEVRVVIDEVGMNLYFFFKGNKRGFYFSLVLWFRYIWVFVWFIVVIYCFFGFLLKYMFFKSL